jgi:hypothetical protein
VKCRIEFFELLFRNCPELLVALETVWVPHFREDMKCVLYFIVIRAVLKPKHMERITPVASGAPLGYHVTAWADIYHPIVQNASLAVAPFLLGEIPMLCKTRRFAPGF